MYIIRAPLLHIFIEIDMILYKFTYFSSLRGYFYHKKPNLIFLKIKLNGSIDPLVLPLPTPPVVNTGSTPTKVRKSDLGFCLELLFGLLRLSGKTSRPGRPIEEYFYYIVQNNSIECFKMYKASNTYLNYSQ